MDYREWLINTVVLVIMAVFVGGLVIWSLGA